MGERATDGKERACQWDKKEKERWTTDERDRVTESKRVGDGKESGRDRQGRSQSNE
jgi:hypothetical protein